MRPFGGRDISVMQCLGTVLALIVTLVGVRRAFAADGTAGWPSNERSPSSRVGKVEADPILPPVEPVRTGAHADADAAVVIGVEDYLNLVDVPFAEKDAALFHRFLLDTVGVPPGRVSNLHVIPATREAILREVRARAAEVGPGGTLWVYFSGHGAPHVTGDGVIEALLLGNDATSANLIDRSVTERELLAAAEPRSEARGVVVLLDACFSGKGRDGSALGKLRFAVPASMAAPVARAVVWSAAQGDQYAGPLEGTGHGVFTYFAVGALSGWAADANGAVRLDAARDYVAQALGVASNATGRRQTPDLQAPPEALDWTLARLSAPDMKRPDLRELSLRGSQFARGLSPLPPAPKLMAMSLLPPQLGLQDVDVKALTVLQTARRADKDTTMTPESKVTAWESVAEYDTMPLEHRRIATERAQAWRELVRAREERARQVEQIQTRHAEDSGKLEQLLAMDDDVVPASQKALWRKELAEAYAPWKEIIDPVDVPEREKLKAAEPQEPMPTVVKRAVERPSLGTTLFLFGLGGAAVYGGGWFVSEGQEKAIDADARFGEYREATDPATADAARVDAKNLDNDASTQKFLGGFMIDAGIVFLGGAGWGLLPTDSDATALLSPAPSGATFSLSGGF